MGHFNMRCGRCGAMFYSGYEDPEKLVYFGQTYQKCPMCGNETFIVFAYEWENLTPEQKKVMICFGPNVRLNGNPDAFLSSYKRDRKGMEKWRNFSFDESVLEIEYIKESIERTADIEYKKKLLLKGRQFYGTKL